MVGERARSTGPDILFFFFFFCYMQVAAHVADLVALPSSSYLAQSPGGGRRR